MIAFHFKFTAFTLKLKKAPFIALIGVLKGYFKASTNFDALVPNKGWPAAGLLKGALIDRCKRTKGISQKLRTIRQQVDFLKTTNLVAKSYPKTM